MTTQIFQVPRSEATSGIERVLQLAVATAGKYGSDGRFILWGVGGTDAILLIVVSSVTCVIDYEFYYSKERGGKKR
ncbi:uncharacterized protein BO96DRAFT_377124 [Aspergillus niger CBS 101883]|uniref:Contig An11c0340, genomic contig n=2 Tax=Aspergillus niger TaxID=5061 RepID=A5ABU6_ASPNC|nr:uncharacterized protein BO96DRAFT_377124 [Aspergillus niger CBS 101883]XP_059606419.1 uncharacterized protein An11g10480 [Aspergillus niger]PYH51579.1 hypothetical protein BO96DRAFT_377124 [Aspergillus niger CBS 101883]CAK97131.1 unnamed protein product [Aspergillus niger]